MKIKNRRTTFDWPGFFFVLGHDAPWHFSRNFGLNVLKIKSKIAGQQWQTNALNEFQATIIQKNPSSVIIS